MILSASSGVVIRLVLFLALLVVAFTCLQMTTIGSISAAEMQVASESITAIPMTPASEGGGGVGVENASPAAWIVFGVGLGPFIVLMAGLLWLTIKIDN